ncbi:MAG: hypothetical protein D6800_06540 [Candidatus Zixiibacteriota bacterium]|nr:MAG: hypothetical protein D6800_06540 [candidate division Zixibacteria bacterium]
MDAKKVSFLSMLAASSCCVPPLILLGLTVLGIGSAGLAGFSTTLGTLKWYLLPLAIVGVGVSYWLYFREKKKCASGCCAMSNEKLTKVMLTISTVVVLGFLAWSVYPYVLGRSPVAVDTNGASGHLAVFKVDGMTCGGCELSINGAVEATGLVDSVKSDFTQKKAWVWYSRSDIDFNRLEEAIRKVGYKPELLTAQ